MKKLAIALTLVFLWTFPCWGSNFIEIYRDNNFLIYVDNDSVKDSGRFFSVWTKWILRGAALKDNRKYYKSMDYFLELTSYMRNERLTRLDDMVIYDKDRRVISNKHNYSGWKNVVPQSVGEAVYDTLNLMYKNNMLADYLVSDTDENK